MSEVKTKLTNASVSAFLDSVDDVQKRSDCRAVIAMMREVTGKRPRMWGASMIGFGSYHYRYASGREGDWLVTGCSPRKQNLAIYMKKGDRSIFCDGQRNLVPREKNRSVPLFPEGKK